jgi:4-alpha-glucanotransferase
MAPLQDVLNLGRGARMNIPGRPEGNWRWRCTENMLSNGDFEWLRDLTKNSNRLGTRLDFPTGKMLKAGSRT